MMNANVIDCSLKMFFFYHFLEGKISCVHRSPTIFFLTADIERIVCATVRL